MLNLSHDPKSLIHRCSPIDCPTKTSSKGYRCHIIYLTNSSYCIWCKSCSHRTIDCDNRRISANWSYWQRTVHVEIKPFEHLTRVSAAITEASAVVKASAVPAATGTTTAATTSSATAALLAAAFSRALLERLKLNLETHLLVGWGPR